MSRAGKQDVHAALTHVAQQIIDAGGADGRVSRADMQAKLETLQGTERDLADIFFRFIDHRDYGVGNTITKTDVDKALAYAKEKMIDKYDLNNNGLSKAEISDMSRTGQLAVALAKELKAAENDVPTGEALANKFESLAEGLLHMSDADYPYEAFTVKPKEGQSMMDAIRSTIDLDILDTRDHIQSPADLDLYEGESIDDYFGYYLSEHYAPSPAEAKQFTTLRDALKSELSDVKLIQMDEAAILGSVYIVGTAPDGSLAGLTASRVWT